VLGEFEDFWIVVVRGLLDESLQETPCLAAGGQLGQVRVVVVFGRFELVQEERLEERRPLAARNTGDDLPSWPSPALGLGGPAEHLGQQRYDVARECREEVERGALLPGPAPGSRAARRTACLSLACW
jgi:hypothetical protein